MAFGGETAESYYDEGLTAAMKGDVPLAVRCFEKALQLDRTMTAAYQQLAKCQLRLGDAKRAVAILEKVIVEKPAQISARMDLASALLNVGDTIRARSQFMQVLAGNPDHARAKLGLAQVCFQEGNWDSAMTLAQAACEQGEPNFAALYILGRAAKLAGHADVSQKALDRAAKLIEHYIELNPSQPEGYYLRGEIFFALLDFASALERYRAAADRAVMDKYYLAFGESFTFVDILAKQGLCCQRLGSNERARELGEKICAAVPNHKIGQSLKAL